MTRSRDARATLDPSLALALGARDAVSRRDVDVARARRARCDRYVLYSREPHVAQSVRTVPA